MKFILLHVICLAWTTFLSIHFCEAATCLQVSKIMLSESIENVATLRNEAFSQIAKGQIEEGIRLLDSVYALRPDSIIYLYKALAYAEKGDYGRARKSLNMMKATYSTKSIDDAKGRAFLSLFLKGKKKGLKCIRKLDPSAAERFNDMLEESCSPKEVYSAFFESIFGAYR